MARINITDEYGLKTGKWFDSSTAERFDEDTEWNGNNHISVPTGSQWSHQCLFKTKGGLYILDCYADYQGSKETYEVVSKAFAADWLSKNGYKTDDIPVELVDYVNSLEIE